MTRKIQVDYHQFHRLRHTIKSMQGKVFYCEDEEGVLRRWYPPLPPQKEAQTDD